MADSLYNIYKYVLRRCSARHSYGFGVHSPYVFYFTKYVVCEKHPFYVFDTIESRRKALLHDKERLRDGRRVGRQVGCAPKYGRLLYRIVRFVRCRTILELGTSLGITTAYLASAVRGAHCVALESDPESARMAQDNLRRLSVDGVEVRTGRVADGLAAVLREWPEVDLVYVHACHRPEDVRAYVGQCAERMSDGGVVVLEDIYRSRDMERVWHELQAHERVTSSIDLWRMGILLFNTDLHRKNYRMMM